jgi:hypothetical protein
MADIVKELASLENSDIKSNEGYIRRRKKALISSRNTYGWIISDLYSLLETNK